MIVVLVVLLAAGVLVALILGCTLSGYVGLGHLATPTRTPTPTPTSTSTPTRTPTRSGLSTSPTPIRALDGQLVGPLSGSASQSAQGTTRYMSTRGRDSSPCTRSRPCATLAHIGALMSPGDEVIVDDGIYTAPQTFTASGSVSAPVTITAQDTGAVTITYPLRASDAVQQQRLLWLPGNKNVTINGLSFVGMLGRPDRNPADCPGGPCVGGGSGHYGDGTVEDASAGAFGVGITYSNLTILDSQDGCLKFNDHDVATHNYISGCGTTTYAHDIYANSGHNTITYNYVGTSPGWNVECMDADCRVADNYFYDVPGGAPQGALLEPVGPSTATANYIDTGGAIGVKVATGVTVMGNLLVNNGYGVNCGRDLGGCAILNNTFYDSGIVLADDAGYGGQFTQPITFENNIVYNDTPTALTNVPFAAGVTPIIDHNDYVNVTLTRNTAGHDYDGGHSVIGNPLCVAARLLRGDFHIRPGSLARGNGLDLGAAPCGHPTDIGALPSGCG